MNNNNWINVINSLPELLTVYYNEKESVPVLVVQSFGTNNKKICVATLQQYEDDTPQWFTNCSEHWDITKSVTHWMPLPNIPT